MFQLQRPPLESSRRIASLGPIASCLREALDEIQRVDQDNEVSPPSSKVEDNSHSLASSSKRKRIDHDRDHEGARESDSESELSLDGTMSEAIFDAYIKSVASTNFVLGKEERSSKRRKGAADGACEAPPAMLTGEVDCVNRIGGQWRMVVNNAVMKRRTFIRIGNGMSDTQYRTRLSLDWDDSKDAQPPNEGEEESEANGSVIYRFPGKIQILAYDDST
mmetsp:Transcript_11692/g.27480  ORF Transcript_11692/g.27480 Transcript_11692/m.27480 type:complete len:220 (-) Transcript_11692:1361-2020(-)